MAFLVFEGLDGSGKSTLIKKLSSFLKFQGQDFICTREPGGTSIGEKLREILIADLKEPPSPRTELLLYEAIRSENVEKVIQPALKKEKWVLSDRYSASTRAFQCGGRGIDEKVVKWLNNYVTGGLKPDCWILLDLNLEEAQERMNKRFREGQKKDRFEKEELAFHQRVYEEYKKMACEEDWIVLNGKESIEEVFAALLKCLMNKNIISQSAVDKYLAVDSNKNIISQSAVDKYLAVDSEEREKSAN